MHITSENQNAALCYPLSVSKHSSFSPYINNGGTLIAVANEDYVVCVADTRLSMGYRIHTRLNPKWTKLTDKVILASAGMQADISTLHRTMKHHILQYKFRHHKDPSIRAIAQLLSTALYYKRFFPYYAFNALVGQDQSGKGMIYSYDAIGSYESVKYTAQGSASVLAIPILDSQCKGERIASKEKVVDLAKQVLVSISERDILTGDFADIIIIDTKEMHVSQFPLRMD